MALCEADRAKEKAERTGGRGWGDGRHHYKEVQQNGQAVVARASWKFPTKSKNTTGNRQGSGRHINTGTNLSLFRFDVVFKRPAI